MDAENVVSPERTRKALSFDEARAYLGNLSRPTLYGLDIPSFLIGRRRYFLVKDLDQFLEYRRNQ